MKIKNNVGPKIAHWGTPDFIYAGVDSPLSLSIISGGFDSGGSDVVSVSC